MAPSTSSVYFVPIKAVIVAFLIEVIPMYPSMHPVKIISPLVLITEIYDLCCFTPPMVMISDVLGVNSLSLLSSHANTICLPV